MDTSRIVAAAGAVVLIAILLLAWLADTIPVDNARSLNSCTLVQCRVYLVLRDFQTILGAAAALLAAYIATQPVWQQLRKMAVQQDIMARQIIADRLKSAEQKTDYLVDEVTKLSQNIFWSIHDQGDDDEPALNMKKGIRCPLG